MLASSCLATILFKNYLVHIERQDRAAVFPSQESMMLMVLDERQVCGSSCLFRQLMPRATETITKTLALNPRPKHRITTAEPAAPQIQKLYHFGEINSSSCWPESWTDSLWCGNVGVFYFGIKVAGFSAQGVRLWECMSRMMRFWPKLLKRGVQSPTTTWCLHKATHRPHASVFRKLYNLCHLGNYHKDVINIVMEENI